MLIFQINSNELKKDQEVTGKDWLFWNAYLKERVEENDYALLPAYINYITNTDVNTDYATYGIEFEDGDDVNVT